LIPGGTSCTRRLSGLTLAKCEPRCRPSPIVGMVRPEIAEVMEAADEALDAPLTELEGVESWETLEPARDGVAEPGETFG